MLPLGVIFIPQEKGRDLSAVFLPNAKEEAGETVSPLYRGERLNAVP